MFAHISYNRLLKQSKYILLSFKTVQIYIVALRLILSFQLFYTDASSFEYLIFQMLKKPAQQISKLFLISSLSAVSSLKIGL